MKTSSKRKSRGKNLTDWRNCNLLSRYTIFIILFIALTTSCPICKTFKKNDYAVYKVTVSVKIVLPEDITTNEQIEKIIDYYESINNTLWNVTIEYVKYPNFRITVEKHLKNGTSTEEYEGNVETGNPDLNMWIISANLSTGEPIYRWNSSGKIPLIESEPIYPFANLTRKTVYANFSLPIENGIESSFGVFWDKKTGVLCGMSSTQDYLDQDFKPVIRVVTNIVIIETSMWTENDYPDLNTQNGNWFWTYLTATLGIISLILLLFFIKRRKRKAVKRRRK